MLVDEEALTKVEWRVCDIKNRDGLQVILEGIDVVIHCAGVISFWPDEYKQMFEVNHHATEHLVSLAQEAEVSRFIHLSSVEALGKENEKNVLITESTTFDVDSALSQYAISKYRGELSVKRSKLETVVYYPGFVLGAGDWTVGPLQIFKDIYKGLSIYASGTIGIVDVRDLAAVIVDHLMDEKMSNDTYIVVSENISHKSLFKKIAVNLGRKPPSIALSKGLALVAIGYERIKAGFTGGKPLINREMYDIASTTLRYDNQKIKNVTGYEFRTLDETIREVCVAFLKSYPAGRKFGRLYN